MSDRFQTYFEQSHEGIWRVTMTKPVSIEMPEEQQIDRIFEAAVLADANVAFARMYGFDGPAELIGAPLARLMPDNEPNRAYLRAVIAGGYRLTDAESTEIDKDGNSKFFLNSLFGVVREGALIEGWGSQRDITALKQYESHLRQSQKMAAIGRLAGGVAHDFNNLLAIILGSAQLGFDLAPPAHPLRAELQHIRDAAERAAVVTQQLLSFAGRSPGSAAPLSLRTVVTELRPLLDRIVGPGVEIELALGTAPGVVRADRGQVEQILVNLAMNAKDAMPKGGKLTIELGGEVDQDGIPQVRLTVRDSGVGMSDDVRGRLFEPFFTTKGPGKGTGLGLATSYALLAQWGGRFRVESAVGGGSAFHVLIPRRMPSVAPIAGGSETVLVVDDEPHLRNITARALRRFGYVVMEAHSTQEALSIVRESRVDLLLTDVVMPGTGGAQLAAQAIALRPALKVVFTSGYAKDAQLGDRGNVPEGSAILPKPWTLEAMGRIVREVLDKR